MEQTSITFKLTKQEKRMLEELARKSHLSVSAFIRVRCLSTKI